MNNDWSFLKDYSDQELQLRVELAYLLFRRLVDPVPTEVYSNDFGLA